MRQQHLSKGREIQYKSLITRHYLLPESQSSLEDQQLMFLLRVRMNNSPTNYSKEIKPCETNCGQILSNEHILNCESLNTRTIDKSKYNNVTIKV
jgi:hypothetical protein